MKAMMISVALVLAMGCGKKADSEPEQAKGSSKPVVQDLETGQPKEEVKKPGTVLWEFETEFWVDSSPAIGPDGTVYIGAQFKVYALRTTSQGLAKSPWPMRGQNAQHTGRAPKK